MAKIIEIPGFGPVNEGEQRVLDSFAERLGPEVRIYPNVLMRVKADRFAEFDQIVLTDDRIWVVEVKDLYGHAIFYRGNHLVDGQKRTDPVASARLKAQQLKERLELAEQDGGVFVDHRVVLAKQPQRLDVETEYDGYVLSIDEAISVITDPMAHGLMRRHIPIQRFDGIEAALALRPRPVALRPRFGNIEAVQLLAERETARMWSAREVPLEKPWLIEELVRPAGATDEDWGRVQSAAISRVRMLQFLAGAPGILVPQTVARTDAGAIGIVHPVADHPTLEELAEDVAGWSEELRRRIVLWLGRAVAACHAKAMAHRQIGPAAIRVEVATGRAWLSEFSRVLRTGDDDPVPGTEWAQLADGFWAAPEHLAGGPVGQEADLHALGSLVRMLWPDGVPADLVPAVDELTAHDPVARRPGLDALRAAVAPQQAQKPVEPATGVSWAGYLLQEQLGVGREPGVSVWRAMNELTRKPVVVRIYDVDADQGGAAVLANALQGLSHDNLAQVLSAGTHRERAYVASEFVPGPSVRTALDAMGPLGVEPAVTAAVQVLDALARVHPGHGDDRPALLHRRVNQDNVIVEPGRGAVLVNFGPPPSQGTQVAVNEAPYRPAGEATLLDDPDPDLFAVGVLLHEIATGRHPFHGEDPVEGELSLDPMVGEALAEVLGRALAPDRERRFATAQEFLAALVALGLPAVVVPQVAEDILEVRRRIDQAVRERRWDDAEAACPGDWEPVRARIRADRARWEIAEANAPLLTVEGFRLRFLEERRDVNVALPGSGDAVGDERRYLADRIDGTALTIAVFRTVQGHGLVRVTDVLHGDAALQRLQQGLRIGIRPLEDGSGLTMDLRQARYVADPKPGKHPISQFLVTEEELDRGAGVDVAEELQRFGSTGYGTRERVVGERGVKRNEICVTFPREAVDLPAAVYLLTRIAPIVRGVRHAA